MIRNPRSRRPNATERALRKRQSQRRKLRHEKLEAREMFALLSSGNGDGHLQVWVNEYGAFGRSGDLDVTTVLDPQGPREVNDAFYDPVGTQWGRAGTTFESGVAIKVGGDPTIFLTDGTIANTGQFANGAFQTPIDPNQRILRSTFFYPPTALPNGAGATLRIDLFQQVQPFFVSGTTPVGVTLQQQYTVTNLTGAPVDVQLFRYFDGDVLHDGNAIDGAGMRQVIQNSPESVFMTNTATNTNLNDPTFIEVRSASTGIVRPNRWEVGLGTSLLTIAPNPPYSPANPGKNQPSQTLNGPLVQKILNGGPLADDVVAATQLDADGNNIVDTGNGRDWAVALRNVYTIPGGGNTVYLTETQFGNPQIGDVPPPVIPPAQRGVVTGQKFSDRNGNGVVDSGELGVAGFRIYADLNNDSIFNAGEPSTVTGTGGFYQLQLNVGTYTIREVNQPNWTQTAPASGFHSVTIAAAGDVIANRNFGNQAAPSQVSGLVFEDFNRNGRLDSGEAGITNAIVYADLNNNGVFEISEPNTTSGAGGTYTLANLDPGSYAIRQIPPSGYEQTFPANNGAQIISTQPGQSVGGVNFGDALLPGQVNGKVYFDVNNNGIIDPGEPGAANVIVYIDRDNNCNIGLGENAIVTGPSGTFGMLGVQPGTYTVRLSTPAGIEQVLPSGGSPGCPGGFTVTVLPGQSTGAIDFLVASTGGFGTKDFGDAPAPYPTTLAQNGARHTVARDFGLGAVQDTELDGQPSPLADNDDFITSPDEDGVQFVDPFRRNQYATIRVTVETGVRSAGRLQGFIDFNQDGDWNDPGERVITNLVLPTGTHDIEVFVPAGATIGRTFARFRYGYEMNLGPTGDSIIGEVEDYDIFIVGPNPIANDDTYTFNETAAVPYVLNVLNNDIPSENGDIIVLSVDTTGSSGTVTIAPDGLSVSYTPAGNDAQDTFTYTVRDPAGNVDTAVVTVNILLPPVLLDNTFIDPPANLDGTIPLDVLANDNPVVGTLTITNVTPPSQGGTVTIVPGGGSLIYTPPSGFSGTTQFTYTAVNGAGISRTANVTVVTGPNANDNDTVAFYLEALKIGGGALDDNRLAPGQVFRVRVTVEDLRAIDPATKGVAAAYIDLLFDPNVFAVVNDEANLPLDPEYPLYNTNFEFNIEFGSDYNFARTGSDNTPGVLDEVGGSSNSATPLGGGVFRVFDVLLVVRPGAANGSTLITTDPADAPVISDVRFFSPLNPAVPQDQIRLDTLELVIDDTQSVDNDVTTGPAGEAPPPRNISGTGQWHNFNMPVDINGDGVIAPLDALMVINALNTSGARNLTGSPLPRSFADPAWLDADGDDVLTPSDALKIINYLNSRAVGEAQGEAPAPAAPKVAQASTKTYVSPTIASSPTIAPEATEVSPSTSTTITLQPGESVDLPLLDSGSTPISSVELSASASGESLSFSAASSLPAEVVLGASSSLDFGAGLGSDDDEDFDSLLVELAQDACDHWDF